MNFYDAGQVARRAFKQSRNAIASFYGDIDTVFRTCQALNSALAQDLLLGVLDISMRENT